MANVPQPVNNLTREFESREFGAFGLQHNINCVPVDEKECDRFNQYLHFLQIDMVDLIIPELEELPCNRATALVVDDDDDGDDEIVVLDCGYGTGKWINDVLDPDNYDGYTFRITGVDIFDRQYAHDEDDSDDSGGERYVAAQEFEKEQWNLNASFRLPPIRNRVRPEMFHLINSRFLSDGIDRDRWPGLIREYFQLLVPGGWVQMVEVEWSFQSDSGRNLPRLEAWWNEYARALQLMRKEPRVALNLASRLMAAGFEEVRTDIVRVPVGAWQSGPGNAAFGTANVDLVSEMLESLALVPFTRILRMSPQNCRKIVRDAQEELRSPNAKIYNRLHWAVGRRPGA